jgi:hypothetical protein
MAFPTISHRSSPALRYLQRAPDVVMVAGQSNQPIEAVARVLFHSGNRSAHRSADRTNPAKIEAGDFYERLAINRTVDGIIQTHRAIVSRAIARTDAGDPWSRWMGDNEAAADRTLQHHRRAGGRAQLRPVETHRRGQPARRTGGDDVSGVIAGRLMDARNPEQLAQAPSGPARLQGLAQERGSNDFIVRVGINSLCFSGPRSRPVRPDVLSRSAFSRMKPAASCWS